MHKEARETSGGSIVSLVEEIGTKFFLGRDEGLVTAVGFGGIEIFRFDLFEAVGKAEESRFTCFLF